MDAARRSDFVRPPLCQASRRRPIGHAERVPRQAHVGADLATDNLSRNQSQPSAIAPIAVYQAPSGNDDHDVA